MRTYAAPPETTLPTMRSVIIGLDDSGRYYRRRCLDPLCAEAPTRFNNANIHSIYHQSFLEIFDCMEVDAREVQARLMLRPNFDMFLEADYFHKTAPARERIRTGVFELGLHLYCVLYQLGLIRPYSTLVLNDVSYDYLIVEHYEERFIC